MAEKTVKKAETTKKIKKGNILLCETCGLRVSVNVCGKSASSKGPSCCGQTMKVTEDDEERQTG